jgi:segregation and condensation protein B
MHLKAKIEALIYAAEEPITLDQMAALLKEDLLALRAAAAAPAEETASEPGEAAPVADSKRQQKSERAELRELLRPVLHELTADYAREERGIEVRQVAGGYRMSTKPEHHDVVRSFSKSLKPPVRLSLPALETLAVIAYKQPVTVPEIGEIRGVDASGVIGTLLERKLITTAGRKAVVGRPMLYRTSKDFLLRFGLNDLAELPSLEEFEKLAGGELQQELAGSQSLADATGVPEENGVAQEQSNSESAEPPPDANESQEQAEEAIGSESSGD